jgi:hypothetical protein
VPLDQAIIAAMQRIRPDGVRRAPSPQAEPQPQAPVPTPAPPTPGQRPSPQPQSRIIDVHGYLKANISIDPATRRLVAPDEFQISGVSFKVTDKQHTFNIASNKHLVILVVKITERGSREMLLSTRDRVQEGVTITARFTLEDPIVVRSDS